MPVDHRFDYSPLKLYVNGSRMVDDYDVDAAVADYVLMHPEADAERIKAELEVSVAGAYFLAHDH